MSEIQRYHPTTNMTEDRLFQVLMDEIVGGDYVLFIDHEAALREYKNLVVQQNMHLEQIDEILDGNEVCDFALSFPLIQKAADKMAALAAAEKRITYLQNDNADRYTQIRELTKERDGLREALKRIAISPEINQNYDVYHIAQAALKGVTDGRS